MIEHHATMAALKTSLDAALVQVEALKVDVTTAPLEAVRTWHDAIRTAQAILDEITELSAHERLARGVLRS